MTCHYCKATARNSRSGAEQSAIWTALKFLGLVDENGNTQDLLRKLAATKENSTEEKELLRALFQSRYKNVFELDLNTATPMQLAEAIGKYNVSGTTRDRAVLFFIKATEHVGLKISERLKKGFRSPATKRSVKKVKADDGGNGDDPLDPADSTGEQIKTVLFTGRGGNKLICLAFQVSRAPAVCQCRSGTF